jgi:hypothetical protein
VKKRIIFLFFAFAFSGKLFAQEPLKFDGLFSKPALSRLTSEIESEASITYGKPQWVKDLRRAEIVAFGSLPLTLFLSSFFIDIYRWASHHDYHYAPWLLRWTTSGVGKSDDEVKAMFVIAASASVAVALTDYIIVRIKRSKSLRRDGRTKD